MTRVKGRSIALAVLCLLVARSGQAVGIGPEFEEAMSFSENVASMNLPTAPLSCGSANGTPEGASFSIKGIDDERSKLNNSLAGTADAFCANPEATACQSGAVRGKYLDNMRSAITRMDEIRAATARKKTNPSEAVPGHPDISGVYAKVKFSFQSMLYKATDAQADAYCSSKSLSQQECSCVRDFMRGDVKKRLDSIVLSDFNSLINNSSLCGGNSANGQFDYDNKGSKIIWICPVAILAAFDSDNTTPVQPGFSNLLHLISHEIGHSMDPKSIKSLPSDAQRTCTYNTERASYNPYWGPSHVTEAKELQVSADTQGAFAAVYKAKGFEGCAGMFTPPAAPGESVEIMRDSDDNPKMNTQSELAADSFAAKLMIRYPGPPPMSRDDIASAVTWACGTGSDSGHPEGAKRIQAYAQLLNGPLCGGNAKTTGLVPACQTPP